MIIQSGLYRNDWIMSLRRVVKLLPKAVQENMAKSILFTTVFSFNGREKELTH